MTGGIPDDAGARPQGPGVDLGLLVHAMRLDMVRVRETEILCRVQVALLGQAQGQDQIGQGKEEEEGGSMSKHTPGPWTVCIPTPEEHPGYADGTRDIDVWTGEDGTFIANVGGPPEEQEANAHLIAAAPELLETLRAMPHPMGCHPSEGRHTDVCVAAKAAIAKAEGGSRDSTPAA